MHKIQKIMNFCKDKIPHWFSKNHLFIVIIIIFSYICYICTAQYHMYYTLYFANFDMSIFHQGIWLLSRFSEPFVTVRGLNLFADHTTFINLIFVPIYWFIAHPLILLFSQTLSIGLAAFILFLIVKIQLKSKVLAVVIPTIFLLYPSVHYINFENYHPVVFAIPLVFLLWYSFLTNNKILGLISSLLLVLVKENMPLLLIGVSFYLFFFKKWKPAKYYFAIGIVSFLLIMFVVLPYFQDTDDYARMGRIESLMKFVKGEKPISEFSSNTVLTDKNAKYINDLFLPVGYFPMLNPAIIILNPLIALNIVTDWPYAHEIKYHYTAGVIPTIFIALIESIALIFRITKRIFKRAEIIAIITILLFSAIIITNPLAGCVMPPRINPILVNEIRDMQSIVNKDPISTTNHLLPFFTTQKEIYMWKNPFKRSYYGFSGEYELPPDSKYILLLKSVTEDEDTALAAKHNYSIIKETEHLILYSRSNQSQPLLHPPLTPEAII